MLARSPSSGPDVRTIKVPVSVSTKAPAVRLTFVVRTNAKGKVGAENFFLVDRTTLSDAASGTNSSRTYQ
jgi:hypothetical protein